MADSGSVAASSGAQPATAAATATETDVLAPLVNGAVAAALDKPKKKRRRYGAGRRRHSMSKAARDPRDEPESSKTTRSPSPVAEGDKGKESVAVRDAAAVAAAAAAVAEAEAATAAAAAEAAAAAPSSAQVYSAREVGGRRRRPRSPSPVIDFDGLSRPSIGTRARLEESAEEADKRQKKMGEAVRTLLECVGEDPDRSGLVGTPDRYARALLFFTQGYQQNVRDIVNDAIFHEGHNEMVIVKDIEIFSMCEHHMVPFTGKMHIGYVPFHSVIGLSKLPRIAEMFSRRLQIQERLTKEVANAIMEVLQPQGVAVVMESSHLCMVMRGVEKSSATTITSCVLGCFERKEKTRNEFLSLIGVNRR